MKKHWYLIIILLLTCLLSGSDLINVDKPEGGEWDFKLKKAWEVGDAGDIILSRVRGLCINKKGEIFLWDSKQMKVFVYNSLGEFLFNFGKKGEGPGEIIDRFATSLNITDEYIILHETNTGRVNYFSFDGKFQKIRKILKSEYRSTLKTYLDPDHFLFFVSKNSSPGKNSYLGIYDLVAQKSDNLVKISADESISAKVDGNNMHFADPRLAARTVCFKDKGKIIFGRTNQYLINTIDLKTRKKTSFSITGRKGRKINNERKRNLFKSPYINKKMLKILIDKCPDRATFFYRVLANEDGFIYSFVTDLENKNTFKIDIFSPQGKYLYHSIIKISEEYNNIRNLHFNNSNIYFTAEDENGEIKLVKHLITQPQI